LNKETIRAESIKTVRNLCEIALLIQDREDLLPTILELIYFESQTIVDDFCVVRKEENVKD